MVRPVFPAYSHKGIQVLNLVSVGAVLAAVALTAWGMGRLPDSVPSHFDASGTPDDYRGKTFTWILPMASVVVYLGLTWLGRRPHRLNYPVTITPTNAKAQYENAAWLIAWIKCLIAVSLALLIYFQQRVGLGLTDGLPGWFLSATAGSVMAVSFLFIARSFQLENK
ncbi:MAG: DUF1648 domain-containing protein [Cyclobacteriaceae bacterium]|nr:DUF1648 domain-containing protein [Cyclobacteriaceae bacterium]